MGWYSPLFQFVHFERFSSIIIALRISFTILVLERAVYIQIIRYQIGIKNLEILSLNSSRKFEKRISSRNK